MENAREGIDEAGHDGCRGRCVVQKNDIPRADGFLNIRNHVRKRNCRIIVAGHPVPEDKPQPVPTEQPKVEGIDASVGWAEEAGLPPRRSPDGIEGCAEIRFNHPGTGEEQALVGVAMTSDLVPRLGDGGGKVGMRGHPPTGKKEHGIEPVPAEGVEEGGSGVGIGAIVEGERHSAPVHGWKADAQKAVQ